MKSLRHRLPSLISLMVFEAAARTLNFTRAAEELHVTQAAVSKQIKYLEGYFGFALFERSGRRVKLSPRGQRLLTKVSASFNYLADAVEAFSEQYAVTSVTLAANTAVSHYWLNAAMKGFRDKYPDFAANIRLITSDHTPDLLAEDVDLAIVYDAVKRLGWESQLLFEEALYPVASSEYIQKNPLTEDTPQALLKHELLEYERLEPNWINWTTWFAALGIKAECVKASAYGNSYITLVDAAARGHGVTLGTKHLLDEELISGRLTRLSTISVRFGRGYYLMSNTAHPERSEVTVLRHWLMQYAGNQ